MLTSNAEELRLFLKCTVIGRGVFGPCGCCKQAAWRTQEGSELRFVSNLTDSTTITLKTWSAYGTSIPQLRMW